MVNYEIMTYMDFAIVVSLSIGVTLLIMSALLSFAALVVLKDKTMKE